MDTNTVAEHVPAALDSRGRRIVPRRLRSIGEKRAIVATAFAPGASVAAVAREHGVNANLVFAWHRLQQQGLLEARTRRGSARKLLPVKLLPSGDVGSALRIEFAGGVQLHISTRVDAGLLERVIAALKT